MVREKRTTSDVIQRSVESWPRHEHNNRITSEDHQQHSSIEVGRVSTVKGVASKASLPPRSPHRNVRLLDHRAISKSVRVRDRSVSELFVSCVWGVGAPASVPTATAALLFLALRPLESCGAIRAGRLAAVWAWRARQFFVMPMAWRASGKDQYDSDDV